MSVTEARKVRNPKHRIS